MRVGYSKVECVVRTKLPVYPLTANVKFFVNSEKEKEII